MLEVVTVKVKPENYVEEVVEPFQEEYTIPTETEK